MLRLLAKDAQESEVTAATMVMHEAFYDSAFFDILVANHKELLFDLQRAIIGAGLVGGKIYVTEDDTGVIIGSAILFGPGEGLLSSEEQVNAGLSSFLVKLAEKEPQMTSWWMEYFLPQYASLTTNAMGGEDKKLNAWNLMLIGVRPEHQRRGVGTEMVKAIEEIILCSPEVHENSKMLHLETTNMSKSLFTRLGFVERNKLDVRGDNGGATGQCVPKYCCVKNLA